MAKGPDFVAGDTGSVRRITCRDDDGSVIDLTGATVTIRWKDAAGTLVERPMTVVSPAAGVAEYQFAAGELYSPRMALGYRVTDATGNVITSRTLDVITVRDPQA